MLGLGGQWLRGTGSRPDATLVVVRRDDGVIVSRVAFGTRRHTPAHKGTRGCLIKWGLSFWEKIDAKP